MLFVLGAASGCGEDETASHAQSPARAREEIPAPGPLVAGVAEVKMAVPVGIGTMGYGTINATPSITPFADKFPGTKRQHGALTVKAVALSRGPAHELVFVRADTVGVFQQLRQAVIDQVKSRTGRDLTNGLVVAGNHTHSGPGRILKADGTLTALGDTFSPEIYQRVAGAFVDVVVRALEDQKPAEIGHVLAASSDGHHDRRCQNDPLPQIQEDPTLPVIAVRRAGVLDAVVASYGYHGTILGLADLTLSGDLGSAVEQKIAERFDHPVTVLFFNSWGADMAPGSVSFDAQAGQTGADQPAGFDAMEGLGVRIADVVAPAALRVAFDANADVRARTYRVHFNREVMNYDDETFTAFPHGGVFCGLGGEGVCDQVTRLESLDELCVKVGEGEIPTQTILTAGRIGSLRLVTGPGEWSTNLAAGVLAKVRAKAGGGGDAMFIGYAQDYTGYNLNEADWWQGGYEASGALWGPHQGDYLAARAVEAFETFEDTYATPPFPQPAVLGAFSADGYAPYVAEQAREAGTVASDVEANVSATSVVHFTVRGGDPWLGTPIATLERASGGGGFEAVRRPNGTVIDSDSYDFWIDLAVDPPYDQAPAASARTFLWTIHLAVTRRASSTVPSLLGVPHRLTVRLPTEAGEVVVSSKPFVAQ